MTRARREAERRIQDRIESRLSASHERRLKSVLSKIAREAADAYERNRSIDSAILSQAGKIETAISQMYRDGYTTIGIRMADLISSASGKSFYLGLEKKQRDSLEDMSDEFRRALDEYVARWTARKVTQITSTSMDAIRKIINTGIEEGLTLNEISGKIIRNGIRDAAYRAHLIARTELHGAAQFGSLQAAKESEVVERKIWQPVDDSRTRTLDNSDFDHVNVDPVPLNSPFIVSGEALQFPGDPSGSPGNVIMCRCAVLYDV